METEKLKRVQARLLEMADTVTGILEKNNIRYMIAYGTLLGAVRHGGFIPWDDDFDLWLFEEDYEKALEVLRDELPPDLLIHDRKTDPIYWKAWSSVMDLRSEAHCSFHPDDNALRYKGLTLDLFPIRKMPLREVSAYLDRENMAFLVRKLDSGTMERGVFEEKFNVAALHYADVLRSIERGEGSTEEVYAFIIFLHGVLPDSILPLRRYSFEGREFWGPNNADTVLTECYNDYRTLPAPEKRKSHYDSVEFFD